MIDCNKHRMKSLLGIFTAFFLLPLMSEGQSNIPITCKYYDGSFTQEKPCNALKRVNVDVARGVYADYGNVCLYKNGSWQIGKLIANPEGRHKFEPERSCGGGIVLRDRNPGLSMIRGPKRSQAYNATQKIALSPSGAGYIFDSSAYYATSTNNLSLRDYDINDEVILSCVERGVTRPCSNAAQDSSAQSINFCAPKDFGTTGFKLGRNIFKGSWYVRYTLENQGSFELCSGGVIVANAQIMANKNNSPVTLLTHVSKTTATNLIQSYADGKVLTSGLTNWYMAAPGGPVKRYRGMASCIVNSGTTATKYHCENSILHVNTVAPDETNSVTGYCYANVGIAGTFTHRVLYQTGEGLVSCDEVEIVRKKVVEPSN